MKLRRIVIRGVAVLGALVLLTLILASPGRLSSVSLSFSNDDVREIQRAVSAKRWKTVREEIKLNIGVLWDFQRPIALSHIKSIDSISIGASDESRQGAEVVSWSRFAPELEITYLLDHQTNGWKCFSLSVARRQE